MTKIGLFTKKIDLSASWLLIQLYYALILGLFILYLPAMVGRGESQM